MPAWIFGRPTKCTCHRMARAAAWGSRQKSRTPFYGMPRPAKSVGYFGAVRLRDGRFGFPLETGKFNGPSFFQFLQQLRPASRATGRRVVVMTDHAPYHHSRLDKPWRETHAARFALDFLPPYSPELNPIERVWKLTRRLCLHNRYFENLKDIISAVEAEFANWTTRNAVLRRLCAITMRNYLRRYV